MSGVSIIKRGKSFGLIAYAGVVDGKERRKWLGTYKTRKDAEQARSTLAHHPLFSSGTGPYGSPRLRFGAYLTTWIDQRVALRQIREHTGGGYRDLAGRHILPYLGHVAIGRLSPVAIQSLYAQLLEHLSPATVRQIASIVHASLTDGVKRGLILHNPADNVTPPSVPEQDRSVWTPEQIGRYLSDARATTNPGVFGFYATLIGTGCRPGELLGAAEDSVDLIRGVLHVKTTLVRAGREPVLAQPKTAKGRRAVRLPDLAVDAIRAALVWKKERKLRLGVRFHDGGTLFCSPSGRPLDRRVLRARDHLPRIARLRLPVCRIYDFRHVNLTYTTAAGIDPRTNADRAGHTDPGYLMRKYAHAVSSAQDQAAVVANGLLTISAGSGH